MHILSLRVEKGYAFLKQLKIKMNAATTIIFYTINDLHLLHKKTILLKCCAGNSFRKV